MQCKALLILGITHPVACHRRLRIAVGNCLRNRLWVCILHADNDFGWFPSGDTDTIHDGHDDADVSSWWGDDVHAPSEDAWGDARKTHQGWDIAERDTHRTNTAHVSEHETSRWQDPIRNHVEDASRCHPDTDGTEHRRLWDDAEPVAHIAERGEGGNHRSWEDVERVSESRWGEDGAVGDDMQARMCVDRASPEAEQRWDDTSPRGDATTNRGYDANSKWALAEQAPTHGNSDAGVAMDMTTGGHALRELSAWGAEEDDVDFVPHDDDKHPVDVAHGEPGAVGKKGKKHKKRGRRKVCRTRAHCELYVDEAITKECT